MKSLAFLALLAVPRPFIEQVALKLRRITARALFRLSLVMIAVTYFLRACLEVLAVASVFAPFLILCLLGGSI